MKKNRFFQLLILSLVATLTAILIPNVAGALPNSPQPYRWQWSPGVGGCGGLTSGPLVKELQAILWLDHRYPNMNHGHVDGYWGPNTNNATLSYQASRGLVADGCVGWNTNLRLQRYPDITALYESWDTGRYTWYYRYKTNYPELVTFRWINWGCWQFQWFDGWNTASNNWPGYCASAGEGMYAPYVGMP